MRVLNAEQMKAADRYTIDEIGVPSLVLMENAGRQVVTAIEAVFDDLEDLRVAVLAGRGNNGGDGFVVARTLRQRGVDVAVFLIGRVDEVRGDARVNLEILGRIGLAVVEIANEQDWELHATDVFARSVIVDAIFGTGLRTPLAGMLQTIVADVNASAVPVVSIDLPSGLSADTHELIGDAIAADLTVTLAAPKLPLVLPPAEERCGALVVADIGIPSEVIERTEGPVVELLTRTAMRALIPGRAPDAHKGDFGRVVLVAGSVGKSGAAHLSASSTLRSGAGLVTVATPRSVLPILASMAAEYMTVALPETGDGRVVAEAVDDVLALDADVLAVGPGLGAGAGPQAFVRGLLERAAVPLVLDADAINAFVGASERLRGGDEREVIITPHPGEMARLLGVDIAAVQRDRIAVARAFAEAHHVHVILKGHRTIVAGPDGRVAINPTGNPGMATGGTGDVLTGMVAAWLAQLRRAEAAARLAVYLHGMAGDLAEEADGQEALLASDLVAHIGKALASVKAAGRDEA